MGDELARRVGLNLANSAKPLPVTVPATSLSDGRAGVARLEPLAHEPLVAFGLGQVLVERGGDLGSPAIFGARLHLHERLLLDRVRVGQVLRQLLINTGHGCVAFLSVSFSMGFTGTGGVETTALRGSASVWRARSGTARSRSA